MAPSPREWLWYLLVFGAGCTLWGIGLSDLSHQTWSQQSQWDLFALALVTFASLFRYVRLSDDAYHSVYTLDDVPLYALIFLQGWQAAVVTAGLARLLFELVRVFQAWRQHPERVHWAHVLYHFSNIPMTVNVTAAAGLVYVALKGPEALMQGAQNIAAVAAATAVWFFLAFTQNSITLTLRRQLPLSWMLQVFRQNLRYIRLHVLMLVPLGALLAIFLETLPWVAVLLLVPVVLMHNALEAQHKLRLESVSTIQALARYLEERDQYTQGHSTRVAGYAAAMAACMDMSDEEVEQVRRAGLIHDIGKVDIPDAILRKPGHLTDTERQIMRTHTDRAVDLGRRLVSLSRELPFREAAYHHENFDGSGHYQLVGEEIPLYSRILAVADTFDAMTSDRPYRKGVSLQDALKTLREVSGRQLDPNCVRAFEKALEKGTIQPILEENQRKN
ncbi:HD-GYP domain-containing protein [bacterium]|nr:HD-GYP domain-containing protein [bacterium]